MLLEKAKDILEKNGYIVEEVETYEKVTPEILEKVTQRVKDHIDRVQYFYDLLRRNGYIPKSEYNGGEVQHHDADKLIPRNLKRQSIRYCYSPDELTPQLTNDIQDVVREHVKSNKHHCEYWGNGDHTTANLDCSAMESKYVYEMLADWAATAEERGGTINSWARQSVMNYGGSRWNFSDEMLEILEDCIPFLDEHLDKSMKRNYGLTFIDPAFLKNK